MWDFGQVGKFRWGDFVHPVKNAGDFVHLGKSSMGDFVWLSSHTFTVIQLNKQVWLLSLFMFDAKQTVVIQILCSS